MSLVAGNDLFRTGASTSASSSITITHVVGTLSLTRDIPQLGVQAPPSIGLLTLTSGTNAFTAGVSPTVGTLTLSHQVHTPVLQLLPTVGNLNLASDAPTVFSGLLLAPTIGVLNLTAGTQIPVISVNGVVGSLSLTSNAHVVGITGDQNIIHVTGILYLRGDAHVLGGDIQGAPSVAASPSRGGFRQRDYAYVMRHFLQVAFEKVRPSTKSIDDVTKE